MSKAVLKKDIAAAVALNKGLTKKDAESIVNEVFEVVVEALEAGEKVQLTGFGTFQTHERAARTGRNPQTGEELHIPAKKVPKFKAGKDLAERVANS